MDIRQLIDLECQEEEEEAYVEEITDGQEDNQQTII